MGFRQFAAVLLIQVGNVKSVRLFRTSYQLISTHYTQTEEMEV